MRPHGCPAAHVTFCSAARWPCITWLPAARAGLPLQVTSELGTSFSDVIAPQVWVPCLPHRPTPQPSTRTSAYAAALLVCRHPSVHCVRLRTRVRHMPGYAHVTATRTQAVCCRVGGPHALSYAFPPCVSTLPACLLKSFPEVASYLLRMPARTALLCLAKSPAAPAARRRT